MNAIVSLEAAAQNDMTVEFGIFWKCLRLPVSIAYPCSRAAAPIIRSLNGLFGERIHRNETKQFVDKQAARLGGSGRSGAKDSMHQFRNRYRGKR
jgi:hypothetical protein